MYTALLDRTATGRLQDLGQQLRIGSVRASAAAKSGHPTSAMSAADLMAVLLAGTSGMTSTIRTRPGMTT